jgi:hypothetical protein
MGWLRDLMRGTETVSFDGLARALIAHEDWPGDTRMRARSLAALLGKLDRREQMEWLAMRPGVQLVLARALQVPNHVVRSQIVGTTGVASTGVASTGVGLGDGRREAPEPVPKVRLLRLQDLRFGRPLDLCAERLFPGIPTDLCNPSSWRRTFWHAPSGFGKTIVGLWLSARGLAEYVPPRRVPTTDTCPVFLEVHERAELPDLEALGSRPVCIAAPFAPPEEFGGQRIDSPHPRVYLPALVKWVAARLPPDGRFDPATALAVLSELEAVGAIPDVGCALGLCGALDELGFDGRRPCQPLDVARRHFEAELNELPDDAQAKGYLLQHGFDVVVGLMRRLVCDSGRVWSDSRPLEEWLELVPLERRHGVDSEWAALALSEAEPTVRRADVQRAASRLPPGAFRLVRALEAVGVLRTAAQKELTLGPHWFGCLLAWHARREAIRGVTLEWGEVLLTPQPVRELLSALTHEIERDAETIERVLEIDTSESPAHVAALEATFRCSGFALLGGAELPLETLTALWEEQMRVAHLPAGGIPAPRIEYDSASDPWLATGSWHLAALAVSEQLEANDGFEHTLLRPWHATAPPALLAELYGSILTALEALDLRTPWLPLAYSLIDRLRRTVGLATSTVHPLELPSVVIEEAEHQVLTWQNVAALGRLRGGLTAVESLAGQHRVGWQRVVRAMFAAWDEALRPPLSGSALDPDGPDASLLWRSVPDDVLARVAPHVPYLPISLVGAEALLNAGGLAALSDERLRALVIRVPDAALEAISNSLSDGNSAQGLRLAHAIPLDRTPDLVRCLRALSPPGMPADQRSSLLDPLRERVRARAPGWREAYALLDELEQSVWPLRRAKGLLR